MSGALDVEKMSGALDVEKMSFESFVELLQSKGVDTSQYGVGVAKTLQEFYKAVVEDNECRIETTENGLERHRDIVRVMLKAVRDDGNEYVLHLLKSVREDGLIRKRDEPLGHTIARDEEWTSVLPHCFQERLNLSAKDQAKHLQVDLTSHTYMCEQRESSTFPGIVACFGIHQVHVNIPNINEKDLTGIGLPGFTGFCTLSGDTKYFWGWQCYSDKAKVMLSLSLRSGCDGKKKKDEEKNDASILCCIRVRPFIAEELTGKRSGGKVELCVSMPTKHSVELRGEGEVRKFDFDRCYWSHSEDHPDFITQDGIYDDLGNSMVQHAMNGFNNCMFAYGQSGSGKTFSVLGAKTPPSSRGLLPRIVEGVFKQVDALGSDSEAQMMVSFIEIYKEQLTDLLSPTPKGAGAVCPTITMRSHPVLGMVIPSLTEIVVTDEAEVLKLVDAGSLRRQVAATNLNAASSRSHCIFTFKTSIQGSDGIRKISQTHMVDLAGSERQCKSGVADMKRLSEGNSINLSLSTLARVISDLAKGTDKVCPPFRESKLTLLLKDALCGNCKTCMIAAISPNITDYSETLSTLKFAQSAKQVRTFAVCNTVNNRSVEEELRRELTELRLQVLELEELRAQIQALREAKGGLPERPQAHMPRFQDDATENRSSTVLQLGDSLTLSLLGPGSKTDKSPEWSDLNKRFCGLNELLERVRARLGGYGPLAIFKAEILVDPVTQDIEFMVNITMDTKVGALAEVRDVFGARVPIGTRLTEREFRQRFANFSTSIVDATNGSFAFPNVEVYCTDPDPNFYKQQAPIMAEDTDGQKTSLLSEDMVATYRAALDALSRVQAGIEGQQRSQRISSKGQLLQQGS